MESVKYVCKLAMGKMYIPLSLLWEVDPLLSNKLKVKNGTLELDKVAIIKIVEPLQWSMLFLRLVSVISVVYPAESDLLSIYHATLVTWLYEKRYPFTSIVDYDKRMRLRTQGQSPRDWPTVDLQLMARYLLSAPVRGPTGCLEQPRSSLPLSQGTPAIGSPPELPSSTSSLPVCFRWRDRKCKFGEKCRFRHSCDSCLGVTVHNKQSCPRWLNRQQDT